MNDLPLAERLSKAIDEAGLTHRELESRTGIPKSAIQRYASGVTDNVPISRVRVLAQALNISAEYLLGWADDPQYTTKPAAENGDGQEIKLSANDKIIIELLTSLSDSKKAEAIRYLRYLAEQSDK